MLGLWLPAPARSSRQKLPIEGFGPEHLIRFTARVPRPSHGPATGILEPFRAWAPLLERQPNGVEVVEPLGSLALDLSLGALRKPSVKHPLTLTVFAHVPDVHVAPFSVARCTLTHPNEVGPAASVAFLWLATHAAALIGALPRIVPDDIIEVPIREVYARHGWHLVTSQEARQGFKVSMWLVLGWYKPKCPESRH